MSHTETLNMLNVSQSLTQSHFQLILSVDNILLMVSRKEQIILSLSVS